MNAVRYVNTINMIAISAFNGCWPRKVTGLVVTRPCNFPNAIKLPVKVRVPIKTLRIIEISKNRLGSNPIFKKLKTDCKK